MACLLLAHRSDPKGRVSEMDRFPGPDDAHFQKLSIGWIPKVEATSWV
jgi:hypothetical protein